MIGLSNFHEGPICRIKLIFMAIALENATRRRPGPDSLEGDSYRRRG